MVHPYVAESQKNMNKIAICKWRDLAMLTQGRPDSEWYQFLTGSALVIHQKSPQSSIQNCVSEHY